MKQISWAFVLLCCSLSSYSDSCKVRVGDFVYIEGHQNRIGSAYVKEIDAQCNIVVKEGPEFGFRAFFGFGRSDVEVDYGSYAVTEGCIDSGQYCVSDRVETGEGFGNKVDVVVGIFPDESLVVDVIEVKNGFELGKLIKIDPREMFY